MQPIIKMLDYAPEIEIIPPCMIIGMPDVEYFAFEAVNFSGLKEFAPPWGTPGQYYANVIKKVCTNPDADDQTALDIGTAVHSYTLFDTWDNTAKCFQGTSVAARKNRAIVENCSSALRARPSVEHLLNGAFREVVLIIRDPETGLLLKCKIDILSNDFNIAVDIKTTADLAKFIKWSFNDYGYALQEQHYLHCMNLAFSGTYGGMDIKEFQTAEPFENRSFLFMVVEKKRPWKVQPVNTKNERFNVAMVSYRNALNSLAECYKNDTWYDDYISI